MDNKPTTVQKQIKEHGFFHCPHCGKGANYFYVWSIKSKGEYLCKKCGNCSDIRLSGALIAMGWGSVLLAAAMLALFILTDCNYIFLLPLMLAPFFVFTVIAPFFVKLRKIGEKKKRSGAKPAPINAKPAPTTGTRFNLDQK